MENIEIKSLGILLKHYNQSLANYVHCMRYLLKKCVHHYNIKIHIFLYMGIASIEIKEVAAS